MKVIANRLFAIAAILTALACRPAAAVTYTVRDITSIAAQGCLFRINNAGQVLSYATGHVDICQPNGTLTNVSTSPAGNGGAINNAGDVWGTYDDTVSSSYAFHWTQGSGATNIGLQGLSLVTDANDTGRLLGNGIGGTGVFDSGGNRLLSITDPIRRINNNGVVVGSHSGATGFQAATWQADGTMQLLTTPSGYSQTSALDINNSGWVIGNVTVSGAGYRPVLWTPTGTPILLDLPTSSTRIRAMAINDQGLIVGDDASHLFVWNTTGAVVADLGAGWATDISDNGKIVGYTASGVAVWTPSAVPEPSSLVAIVLGLMGTCAGLRRPRRTS